MPGSSAPGQLSFLFRDPLHPSHASQFRWGWALLLCARLRLLRGQTVERGPGGWRRRGRLRPALTDQARPFALVAACRVRVSVVCGDDEQDVPGRGGQFPFGQLCGGNFYCSFNFRVRFPFRRVLGLGAGGRAGALAHAAMPGFPGKSRSIAARCSWLDGCHGEPHGFAGGAAHRVLIWTIAAGAAGALFVALGAPMFMIFTNLTAHILLCGLAHCLGGCGPGRSRSSIKLFELAALAFAGCSWAGPRLVLVLADSWEAGFSSGRGVSPEAFNGALTIDEHRGLPWRAVNSLLQQPGASTDWVALLHRSGAMWATTYGGSHWAGDASPARRTLAHGLFGWAGPARLPLGQGIACAFTN